MAGTTKKPVAKKPVAKKAGGKKPAKTIKKALEPCDKPQAAESSRPMQEDGACDDGVK